jgi:NDP-sugar pyrophosphorylase family protein
MAYSIIISRKIFAVESTKGWLYYFCKKQDRMKAMIFAAGFGTRLKPLTDTKPKALVEIGGKTLLEITIEKLKKYGIREVVVNTHHLAGQIVAYLNEKKNFGISIHISDESEMLLDTGGGLKKAAPFLAGGEPVVIHNVDILSDINLDEVARFHLKEKALATIVVRDRETKRYLLFDERNHLSGWENKETGEVKTVGKKKVAGLKPYAFSGIHIIDPKLFGLIKQDGKFSIIDTYLSLADGNKIIGYLDNSELWLDVGKPGQLEEARQKPER